MAISKKVMFEFDPLQDLGVDIKKSDRKALLKDIADYVLESVLSAVGSGESPVAGESFPKLTKEYANKEHGGNRKPVLELSGDMLDSLRADVKGDSIVIGVSSSQEEKADGHNQLTKKAQSWAEARGFPRRRFIPEDGQSFGKDIQKGIDSIIADYLDSKDNG